MMRAIVEHMAALTEAAQPAQPVIGRIVIQMRGGEHDARRPQPRHLLQVGPAGNTATSVAPRLPVRIVPPPVSQAAHGGAVRPAAALADAAGALETDAPAEVAPMGGVEVAELSPDRHGVLKR